METKTPEPIKMWMSILAGLQAFFAGSAGVSAIVAENKTMMAVFAFGGLAVAAAQLGMGTYLRGLVVPVERVAEYVSNGLVVAGPANSMVPEGAVVRPAEVPALQVDVEEEPAMPGQDTLL